MIEKYKKKLAVWKTNLLSFGGRLTVIKSTFLNLPIYCLFIICLGVICEIEKKSMVRAKDGKGLHLVC